MRRVMLFLSLLIAAAALLCQGCGKIQGPSFPLIPSPRVTVATPTGPASGDISVTFQLIDRELESADILVQYSTDGGQTFATATLTNPSDAVNLGSGWYPGTTHTLQWDSVSDMVGRSGEVTVCVKITPSDATNPSGTPDITSSFTVNNIAYNEAPSATVSTPAGVQSGNIQINYFLADVESDTCSIVVDFSTNGGSTYQSATMGPAGDGLTGLSSSPSGAAHTFLWDSRTDNVGLLAQQDNVRIRITPTDFNEGTVDETNSFSVDNTTPNIPPTVNITSGPSQGSTVYTSQVTFGWSGSDTDGTVTGYYYSFDQDPPDAWATNTSVTSGVLSEASHTFRVAAMDDEGALSTVASRTFTVSTAVIQADFTGSPVSGTVPLSVSFTDTSTSTSGITSWSWSFGDGGSSTSQNPNHTYSSAGNYTVALTVSGPDGSDTETKTNYITATSPGGNTIYVDGAGGNDLSDGLSWASAVKTIQTGLDKASDNWTVLVADGTYTGTNNKNLYFTGKAIHLRSAGGAANCVIDCENDGRGFGFNGNEAADTTVYGFTVTNGRSSNKGGAFYFEGSSPTIINCTITGNNANWEGGGVWCGESSNPSIINCTISNNWTTDYEGGGIYCDNSSPTIINCLITNNTSHQAGGGIYCNYSNPIIINCIVANNTASIDSGGGMICGHGSVTITNCTIANNSTAGNGGGIRFYNCDSRIHNTILWGNSASTGGNQIYAHDINSSVEMYYCDYANDIGDVEGMGTVVPNNCKTQDPQFINTAGGDYHLQSGSPCINAGNNDLVPPGVEIDLDNRERVADSTVDIGAFEYGSPQLSVVADFIASPIVGSTALTVQFTDLSSGNITSWEWDFDNDGTVDSSEQNPSYEYTTANVYTVTLTVTGLSGSDAQTKTSYICVVPSAGGTLYVDGTNGFDTNSGFSWAAALRTIQTGLDRASDGWSVIVANGTYRGRKNRGIDFKGKAVHLKSAGGAINCIIDCENSSRGFGFVDGETNATIVEGFTVRNARNGTIYAFHASPTIAYCIIANSINSNYGGGMDFSGGSMIITGCTFVNNTASRGGGIFCSFASPTITNCAFVNNTATSWDGGGIYCQDSIITINNCTIANNTASERGAGIANHGGTCTLNNTILWGNVASTTGHQIYTDTFDASVILDYCDYANGDGDTAGIGTVTEQDACLYLNPLFVNAAGGDYHLQAGSPCIDAGDNSYVSGVTTDLDGNARIANTTVDIGVYEYQTSPSSFARTWGGASSDVIYSLAADSGGNIYCAGSTRSFGAGDYDALLLRYDSAGTLQWAETWGGANQDFIESLAVDSGGNIYCAGYTHSFGAGSYDVLLLRYDSAGTLQWARTWGGVSNDRIESLAVDSGGNIYCAGYTSSFGAGSEDALLLKYDSAGTLQWARTWGGADSDWINSLAVDSGGNIYCAGGTESFGAGNYDALLLRYNSAGTLQWARTWGGVSNDYISSLAVDSGDNIYCADRTGSFGAGSYDALLLKYDSAGTLQWARTWGGASDDLINSLAVDSGGNTYCAGDTGSFGAGGNDALLLRYDGAGILQWVRTWGGASDDYIYSLAIDSGGDVHLGGRTDSYTGAWQIITAGTESSPSGTQGTPSGSQGSPAGTQTSPTGTEGSPAGSETGAGGYDTLLLKNWE